MLFEFFKGEDFVGNESGEGCLLLFFHFDFVFLFFTNVQNHSVFLYKADGSFHEVSNSEFDPLFGGLAGVEELSVDDKIFFPIIQKEVVVFVVFFTSLGEVEALENAEVEFFSAGFDFSDLDYQGVSDVDGGLVLLLLLVGTGFKLSESRQVIVDFHDDSFAGLEVSVSDESVSLFELCEGGFL